VKGDAIMPTKQTRESLRQSPMMSHLLDALAAGTDIGEYGRLTVAMVAHHFLEPEDLVALLAQDASLDESQARALVQQVQARDYSPPKRERILEWQAQQAFPICPNPDDPDACNVYQDLAFPETVFQHIEEYREQQFAAEHEATAGSQRGPAGG
jgi:hypothetical protein